MKKIKLLTCMILILLFSACANLKKPSFAFSADDSTTQVKGTAEPEPTAVINPVDYYAVLAEKDDYTDVGMTDLLVDYIDIQRVREALESLGWSTEQIHELRDFNQESLITELDWLEENADDNDLVFFYITSHGSYLRNNIGWKNFFPEEWAQIVSEHRILVIDSCTAAEFTIPVMTDPNPHLSIAAVDDDEYGWKGIKEEGLPIIGGIFTYYFTEALTHPETDHDGDGLVSVQEAALVAEEKQRDYMHEVVFAVPEFLEMYPGNGVEPEKDESFPDVIVDDAVGEPVFLTVID